MDKDLEKLIEQYALSNTGLKENFDRAEEEYYQREKVQVYDMLKEAIKSDVSKEYWQQGMYTESEMYDLVNRAIENGYLHGISNEKYDFIRWYNKNKKSI